MDDCIIAFSSNNQTDITSKLSSFIIKYATAFDLHEPVAKRKQLVNFIFEQLQKSEQKCNYYQLLQVIRILTRDKNGLEELFTQDKLNMLSHLARLVGEEEAFMTENNHDFDPKVIVEAQKCLCNLIYQSPTIQMLCSLNSCIEGIMLRLRMYKDPMLPIEIKYFDMRMLFILTALNSDVRRHVHMNHGFVYLMEVVDLILKQTDEPGQRPIKKSQRRKKDKQQNRMKESANSKEQPHDHELDDTSVDLCIEVLKILFNLSYCVDKYNIKDVEEAHYLRMVGILHDLLLTDTKSKDKRNDLQNHVVNLLTNVPPSCYEELIVPIQEIGKIENTKFDTNLFPFEFEYRDYNVEALAVVLDFLNRRLDIDYKSCSTMHESLAPILTCVTEMGRCNSIIRKYFRSQILPPLRDVMHRPEEGGTLRNKLVKQMTAPNTNIKELVAEFLFILCKENVGRLIKYTGYGNAAGLLANRGLMLGGRGKGNYSSDSEDSDTEEYLKFIDKINPVTGCYEEPKPNPMDGLSDEQKEYEAMQLVEMIDKLQKSGIVQPCRVGEDGKPIPVEHILELQGQTLVKQAKDKSAGQLVQDSDSD